MSRFLKERHIRLVIVGVRYLHRIKAMEEEGRNPYSLDALILMYMDSTGVSYTMKDVEEIKIQYLIRYKDDSSS